jgi:outer membrane murein-binding lipoprotein Lpp
MNDTIIGRNLEAEIDELGQRVQTLEGLLSSMSTDLNEIKEAIQNATKT